MKNKKITTVAVCLILFTLSVSCEKDIYNYTERVNCKKLAGEWDLYVKKYEAGSDGNYSVFAGSFFFSGKLEPYRQSKTTSDNIKHLASYKLYYGPTEADTMSFSISEDDYFRSCVYFNRVNRYIISTSSAAYAGTVCSDEEFFIDQGLTRVRYGTGTKVIKLDIRAHKVK